MFVNGWYEDIDEKNIDCDTYDESLIEYFHHEKKYHIDKDNPISIENLKVEDEGHLVFVGFQVPLP